MNTLNINLVSSNIIISDQTADSGNYLTSKKVDNHLLNSDLKSMIIENLTDKGWVLLRGFNSNVDSFSQLIKSLSSRLTYDPARLDINDGSQKVDAGTQSIGLHIENGNTPFPPDIVAFFSNKSARIGSQTTVCDGHEIYKSLPNHYRKLFSENITVSRLLPENIWKQYVANEHPSVNHINEVTKSHLKQLLELPSCRQSYLNNDNSLHFVLETSPILHSNFGKKPAFANALLGPSFNYEPPVFRFSNGEVIDETMKSKLADIASSKTHEINWQDNDIAIIDNKRVMHGRREILDDSHRELFIAMGII